MIFRTHPTRIRRITSIPTWPNAQRPRKHAVDSAAIDRSILNYAILNGALALLPQSWASMAIIALPIKMVYRVGLAHGVSLDQGHIKEFIAAATCCAKPTKAC